MSLVFRENSVIDGWVADWPKHSLFAHGDGGGHNQSIHRNSKNLLRHGGTRCKDHLSSSPHHPRKMPESARSVMSSDSLDHAHKVFELAEQSLLGLPRTWPEEPLQMHTVTLWLHCFFSAWVSPF